MTRRRFIALIGSGAALAAIAACGESGGSGATAKRTIPEEVSLNRRERIYYEFSRGLIERLDGTMEKSIRKHLYLLVR